MRELKFRVWSKVLKRFLSKEEYVLDLDGRLIFVQMDPNSKRGDEVVLVAVNPNNYVIQRYINLQNIYEGDIVEWDHDSGDWVANWEVRRGIVEWDEDWCRFVINRNEDKLAIGMMDLTSYRVIGNIFENKDLLK